MSSTDAAEYGVLTRNRVIAWVGGGILGVALASVLVGEFGTAHGGFDWEIATLFGTALGTTALAGFTAALAFTTSGDVRATWELASLTRHDQEARERPVLIRQKVSATMEDPQSALVRIDVRNVGLGPALRVKFEVRHPGPPVQSWTGTRPSVLPGESDTFRVRCRPPAGRPFPADIDPDAFYVHEGKYLDRAVDNEYDLIIDWGVAEPEPEGVQENV